jgi:hypothetical protein
MKTQIEQVNTLLIAARNLAEQYTAQGNNDYARMALQIASRAALQALSLHESRAPIVCRCHKQLRQGKEIRHWQETGVCYACDAAYSEYLEEEN